VRIQVVNQNLWLFEINNHVSTVPVNCEQCAIGDFDEFFNEKWHVVYCWEAKKMKISKIVKKT